MKDNNIMTPIEASHAMKILVDNETAAEKQEAINRQIRLIDIYKKNKV